MIKPEPIAESIKVVAGNPTEKELAALVAILEQAHAEQVIEGKRQVRKPVSSWNRNGNKFRTHIVPGFGQWRAHYRPGLD